MDRRVIGTIRSFFRSRGREMTENNVSQARFPEGSVTITHLGHIQKGVGN